MKEQVYKFIGAVMLTVLALVGFGAAMRLILELPFDGKGPEWIGAIGTVATLIGTIWLAMSGERKRKREAIDRAIITAAQFSLWIVAVKGSLRSARKVLQRCLIEPDPRAILKECGEIVMAAGLWTAEDLAPMVELPNHAAARLAFIKVRIENTILLFTKAGESDQPLHQDAIDSYLEMMNRNLGEELEELEAPHKACIAFLEKHGFKPVESDT